MGIVFVTVASMWNEIVSGQDTGSRKPQEAPVQMWQSNFITRVQESSIKDNRRWITKFALQHPMTMT